MRGSLDCHANLLRLCTQVGGTLRLSPVVRPSLQRRLHPLLFVLVLLAVPAAYLRRKLVGDSVSAQLRRVSHLLIQPVQYGGSALGNDTWSRDEMVGRRPARAKPELAR